MSYAECMKSELDLFMAHPIQSSILKSEEVPYKPVASLDNSSVIEFVSLGNGDSYRDLSSIYLKLRVKMIKNNKAELFTDDKNPSVVNNIMHSLIKQLTIYLNGKPIAQTDSNYAYRAYIENLLNYGNDAASTHLESAGWYLDNAKMDYEAAPTGTTPPTGAAKIEDNVGLSKRKKLFQKSGELEFMAKLHGDMFNQSKLLLNSIDLRIVLSTEKPAFYMLAEKEDDEAYIKITDAVMYMNHVTISPHILLAHETMLQKTKATYAYKRVEVKTYTVPSNQSSLTLDNIIIGRLPNLLVFGMIDNEAYTGKKTLNPFNFKHNDISSFNLSVNGVHIPNQPIQFDYSNIDSPISTRGYISLFKGTGIHFFDKGFQITKQFYDNGCFLLAFDLTTDLSNNSESCTNMLNQGSVRIEIRYAKALPKTITCIVYAEYDAAIEIDKNRNVYTSY